MNRREFLAAVGGTTATLAGWVLVPGCRSPRARAEDEHAGLGPRLDEGVAIRAVAGGGEVVRADESGAAHVVCGVNDCALRVLTLLDGRHTVQSLAGELYSGPDPAVIGRSQAAVAAFLALLAQAGLLADPFYVNLHAVEVTG